MATGELISPQTIESAQKRPPLILLVEDDKSLRNGYSEIIESSGYRVHATTNGQEALEWLSENQPDLILTDYSMPTMNGLELIAIMQGYEELRGIPVILHSTDREPYDPSGILIKNEVPKFTKNDFMGKTIEAIAEILNNR